MRVVDFEDLGLIDYKKAWDYQTQVFDEIVATKIQNRKLEGIKPPVITKNRLFEWKLFAV